MKNEIIVGGDKSQRGGICKYCRQVIMVEAPEEWPAAEVNQKATEQCDCPDAKRERNRRKRMQKAGEWARARFSENDGQLQMVCLAIKTVFDSDFDKVTIKTGREVFRIDVDKDGMIRIQREYKEQNKNMF